MIWHNWLVDYDIIYFFIDFRASVDVRALKLWVKRFDDKKKVLVSALLERTDVDWDVSPPRNL